MNIKTERYELPSLVVMWLLVVVLSAHVRVLLGAVMGAQCEQEGADHTALGDSSAER